MKSLLIPIAIVLVLVGNIISNLRAQSLEKVDFGTETFFNRNAVSSEFINTKHS